MGLKNGLKTGVILAGILAIFPASLMAGENVKLDLSNAALAIYGEARGESKIGQEAIGEALRNRAKLPYYKKKGVFHGVYGYWDSKGKKIDPTAFQRAKKAYIESEFTSHVKGAQYWFSDADIKLVISASWFKRLEFVCRIGAHSFYREVL